MDGNIFLLEVQGPSVPQLLVLGPSVPEIMKLNSRVVLDGACDDDYDNL